MELIEEAHEAALGAIGARIRRGHVGDANLANKIGEAARRAGDLRAMQRVGADSVWRARLATLAREEQGSRRGLGTTYAKGWLIMVGASRTSPVPGSGMRRRHVRR